MLMKRLTWMLIIPTLIGINVRAVSQGRNYPRIRPANITIETTASKPEAAGYLTINDAFGKPAYALKIVVEISDFAFSEDFCPRNKCAEQKGGLVKAKIAIKVQPDNSRRKRPVSASYKLKLCE